MGEYWRDRWRDIEQEKRVRSIRLDGGWQSANWRRTNIVKGIANAGSKDQVMRLADWAERRGVPVEMMRDSRVGGPDIVSYKNIPVTRASVEHAFMAKRITRWWYEVHGLRDSPSTVEIGGGFGGLCWTLHRWLGPREYLLVDSPTVLDIQKHFIETSLGNNDVYAGSNVALYMVPKDFLADDDSYDLFINTRSFGEMDLTEVEAYVRKINASANPDAIFYAVNWENKVTSFEQMESFLDKGWSTLTRRDWPKMIDGREMIEAAYVRGQNAV